MKDCYTTKDELRWIMNELHAYGDIKEIHDIQCDKGLLTVKIIASDECDYIMTMLNGECISVVMD